MGLDMYLYAEKYVSGWDFGSDEEQRQFREVVDSVGLVDAATPRAPFAFVTVTVAYWRKANAIHAWFVANVQGGVDECQRADVDRSQLEALRDRCRDAILAYDSGDLFKAQELLAPQSGFFFGSTEVDDWYRESLSDTVAQLDKALELEGVDFYYRSSW